MTNVSEQICNDEASLLLPWYINDSLPAQQMQQVSNHLQQCAICRADLEQERRIAALMQTEAVVQVAPQAGLQKLLMRITPQTSVNQPVTASEDAHRWPRIKQPLRWLAAAMVLQTAGLAVLGSLLWQRDHNSGDYRTLTTAPIATGTGQLRVMFASQTSTQDLNTLLRGAALEIVSGPSESGLYTLHSRAEGRALDAMITTLRADSRIVFVEPVVAQR